MANIVQKKEINELRQKLEKQVIDRIGEEGIFIIDKLFELIEGVYGGLIKFSNQT